MSSLDQLLAEIERTPSPTRAARTQRTALYVVLGALPVVAIGASRAPFSTQNLAELGLAGLLAFWVGAKALRMGSSALGPSRAGRLGWALAAPLLVLLATLTSVWLTEPHALGSAPWKCLWHGLVFGAAPTAGLSAALWRSDAIDARTAGVLVGVAGALAGQMGMLVACPDTDAVHVLGGHAMAVVLGGLFGGLFLGRFLGLRRAP